MCPVKTSQVNRSWPAPQSGRFGVLIGALLCAAALLAGACSTGDSGSSSNPDAGGSDSDSAAEEALGGDDLTLDEIQVIGSHNSYHLPAVAEVAAGIEALVPALWETISYEHRPLTEQLEDYGIRQFELDVYADPDGGLYSTPAALELLGISPTEVEGLDDPGFKVAHIADIDYNTTCWTLVACLGEIEQWSEANPTHVPIMVMIETKGDDLRSGDDDFGVDIDSLGVEFARPPEMTDELFDDLETEVLSVFDEDRIITPDDIRGDAATLEEAVTAEGWPTIGESRGKVMFALVDTGPSRDLYTTDAPNLADRLFFTSSEPGRADAAFLRIDDSLADGDALASAVEAGYLIRTRTDEPGVHAPAADTSLRDSAMASGAQFLSTDYYVADPDTGYVVSFDDGVVARCNPVTAPPGCEAIEGA